MKTLIACTTCPNVKFNIDLSGGYYGPTISCASCEAVLLQGVVMQPFMQVAEPLGMMSIAPLSVQKTLFTAGQWFKIGGDVEDAQHAPTCTCPDCKEKAIKDI